MAKKKESVLDKGTFDTVAKEIYESGEVPSAVSPTHTEELIPMVAVTGFSDGNLSDAMKRYGYECEWRRDEVRNLPSWLIKRCLSSGAELERVE